MMATTQQIEAALRAADAAGNVEDARRLAQAYADARRQQAPDFSNVQSGFDTTERGQEVAPKGNPITRAIGDLGGRQVLQGAYGTYGALGGDALNEYVLNPIDKAVGWGNQLGIGDRTYRQAASDFADELGMRKPQTAGERIVSDIGEGLTGTALTMGLGGLLTRGAQGAQNISSRLGGLLTAQPGLQAASTATGAGAASATRESGGGQGAQLTAGLIGGLSPGVASYAAGAGTRGLVRGASGENMQRAIDDFASVGATPSVGQASGNRFIQGAENLLGGAPTSAGVVNRFAERQAQNIGAGLQRKADDFLPNASGERAGRAIEEGVKQFGKNTAATKKALYWDADRYIPAQTPVQMPNTWKAITELTTPTQGASATTGALINPTIAKLRATLTEDLAAGRGKISYEGLKRIRTEIGEQMNDFSLNKDVSDRELSRLYGALSEDMQAAAKAQSPQAYEAAKRANTYTRFVAKRNEAIQRVIDKNGGPERVFEAAMSGTRDGGTTLRSVMQSLPKDGQRAVTAAVIKRMGMATPGVQGASGEVFSAQTFLTNWNRISPEARRALFDRHGPTFAKDMDRIARVAQNIREGSRVLANPSGTANRAAAMTYGASLVGSLFTGGTTGLVGAGIGANLMARYLTNPDVVRRLAVATTLPKGSIPPFIHSLRTEGEKIDNADLLELARELEQREQSGPGAANQ